MAVLGIMAIFVSITLSATSSLLRSYNLKLTAQSVVGQLNFARQSALANNQSVEVRFYNITDPVNPSQTVYRGMQCFLVDNSTGAASLTSNSLSKPYFFPSGMIISSNVTVSTLFNTSSGAAGSGIFSSSSFDSNHPLPPPYGSASAYGSPAYLYFRFRPTGQTSLNATATTSPYFTIYPENSKIVANGLPADYITIVIDAIDGTDRIYQP